jgi:NAD+ diphosphatase
MLSRKFGREVANYFSGSPLNRLGFLRADHVFLGRALKHPSTSFMLCKDLQPLVQSSDNKKLKYVKFEDVKAVIGEDPYARNEKEMLAQYNSEEVVPQMIFLGIDESVKEGLDYQGKNRYVGAPFFAVDVTPRGSVKEACEELVKRVETGGAEFGKGRLMELEASDGMFGRELELGVHQGLMLIDTQLLSMLKLASFSTGTLATRSARNAVSPRCQ